MTLDEAIKHCEEKAEELRQQAEHEKQNQLNKVKMFNGHFPADYTKADICLECAREHEQLAEWLKDYKRMKEERPQGEWIEGSNGNIKCNKCGAEIRYSYIANNKPDFPKFCCDCGASMKGGAE